MLWLSRRRVKVYCSAGDDRNTIYVVVVRRSLAHEAVGTDFCLSTVLKRAVLPPQVVHFRLVLAGPAAKVEVYSSCLDLLTERRSYILHQEEGCSNLGGSMLEVHTIQQK